MERAEPSGEASPTAETRDGHLLLERVATARRALDDVERAINRAVSSNAGPETCAWSTNSDHR